MPAKDAPLVCFPCCKLIGLYQGSLQKAIFSIGPVWLQQMANDQSHNFPKWKNAKICQDEIICGRMGMDWGKIRQKRWPKKSQKFRYGFRNFRFPFKRNLKVDFLNFQKFSLNFWVVVLSMIFSHEKVQSELFGVGFGNVLFHHKLPDKNQFEVLAISGTSFSCSNLLSHLSDLKPRWPTRL